MLIPNNSEIKGTFQESPFAELLAEFSQARLSGSFRLAHAEEKSVVYLREGKIVFAVSNLLQHRLFHILLQNNQLEKDRLTEIPQFTKDLSLAEHLIKTGTFDKGTIDEIFKFQIREIISAAISWDTGGWSFSHLARVKSEINFELELTKTLLDFARQLPQDKIIKRFRSFDEKFLLGDSVNSPEDLYPRELLVYKKLSKTPLKIQEISQLTGISDAETIKSLYTLWLAHLTIRKNWNCVIPENRIEQIINAKITLKSEAQEILPSNQINRSVLPNNPPEPKNPEISESTKAEALENYLQRVENAQNFYETLGVPLKARLAEMKAAYFALAKSYHPDLYHHEKDSQLHQRVQNAFTEIARAYETLKDENLRESYDFKLRKYLENAEANHIAGDKQKTTGGSDSARREFAQGMEFFENENYEESAPYFARAVRLEPNNAQYHAYYGKILSLDNSQRFKAEAEIRMAIKLDDNEPMYRLMLAEFYMQFNLLKRAEGELLRLLALFPDYRNAQTLLDSMPGKR